MAEKSMPYLHHRKLFQTLWQSLYFKPPTLLKKNPLKIKNVILDWNAADMSKVDFVHGGFTGRQSIRLICGRA